MTGTSDAALQCLLAFLAEGGDALGLEPRAARRWLDESLSLAGHTWLVDGRGGGAPPPALADAPLLAAVYRDLDAIERGTRAELLRGLARVLCRRAPASLGAAVLDLIAPLSRGAADALRGGFQREAARRVSTRLFDRPSVAVEALAVLGPGADVRGGGRVVRAFADLAQRLEEGLEGRLTVTEVRLALEGGAAVAPELEEHVLAVEESQGAPSARGTAPQDAKETIARDHVARLRAAAAFAAGDDATVLEVLVDGALALDHSASAGALHAASAHRQRRAAARGDDPPAARPGSFAAPVDADERKRIARFLAAATSTTSQTEVETT